MAIFDSRDNIQFSGFCFCRIYLLRHRLEN